MAEGFTHNAGGDGPLQIVRYARDEMVQREAINDQGSAIMPGEALMLTEDANGNHAFVYHDGAQDVPVYVAVEASGRGMDAQTDDGYADGEAVIAVNPSGGGLNLSLATGETVTIGDELVPEANTGQFIAESSENFVFAQADEDKDLSGASNPALVATEVE